LIEPFGGTETVKNTRSHWKKQNLHGSQRLQGAAWKSIPALRHGDNGHELKFGNRKLVGMYLWVGLDPLGRWRMYKLRQDFAAAEKIQLEDDITASVVVPKRFLPTLPETSDGCPGTEL